jgi:hypothetical protein
VEITQLLQRNSTLGNYTYIPGQIRIVKAMNYANYVKYLSEFQSVVCIACKSCVTSEGAKRHFMEHHKNSLELRLRQSIVRYINSLPLVSSTTIELPSQSIPAISELEIHDGWRCGFNSECGYVCRTVDTMKEHYKKKHNVSSVLNLRGTSSLVDYS